MTPLSPAPTPSSPLPPLLPAPPVPTQLFYGQIPLTHALNVAVAAGVLPDLDPVNVVPVLKKQLTGRAQRFDDSAVDVKALPSLQVHVVGQEVKPAANQSEFPVFGNMVAYKDVTAGKAGGARDGNALLSVYIGGYNVQNWVLFLSLSSYVERSVWGFLLIFFSSFDIRYIYGHIYIPSTLSFDLPFRVVY